MKPSPNPLFSKASLLGLATIVVGSSQSFADNTWDGGGASGSWSDLNNWGSNTTPVSPTLLTFAGTAQLSSVNDLFAAGTSFNGITFSAGAGAFNLSGNSLTLGGNITNSSTNTQTIGMALASTASRTVTMTTGGGNVTLSGNLSGTGGALVMAGTGTMVLSGDNSFTGGVTATATTKLELQANAGNTTGGISRVLPNQAWTTTTFPTGATVNLRADSGVASSGAVIFNNTASVGANSAGGRFVGTLNFDVNQLTTGNSNLNLQFGATGGTVWTGGVTINVTGGNGYSLVLPSISVGSNGAVILNNTTAGMKVGGILNGSTGKLTKTGAGTLSITAASNYTGGTDIGASQGAAVLRAEATNALGTTGTITFDTGGNASTARLELAGGITLPNPIAFTARGTNASTAGGVAIQNISGNNTLSGLMTLGTGGAFYTIQSDAGSLALTNTGTSTVTVNKVVTLQGAGDGSYAGVLAGAGGLTKAGTGNWTVSNTSTYTGATVVSAGTLFVNGALANTTGVNVTIGGTLAGTGSIANSVTVATGAFLAPGTAAIESLGVGSAAINGTLVTKFDGTGSGTIDLLAVTGNLDITNATLDLNQLNAGADDSFYILATYGTLTGTAFATVLDLPTGYAIDYAYNDGSSTKNIALVAVPEPAAALLLGTVGVIPLLRRRRA